MPMTVEDDPVDCPQCGGPLGYGDDGLMCPHVLTCGWRPDA